MVHSDNGVPPSKCRLTGGRDDHDQLCDDWHIIHGLDLGPMAVVKQIQLKFLLLLGPVCYTDLKQSQLWRKAAFLALDKMAGCYQVSSLTLN